MCTVTRHRTVLLVAAAALLPAPAAHAAFAASEQLELVAEAIESVLKSAEEVAAENALTYENFMGAAPDSCAARLGQPACFDPADSFATLTQYLMCAELVLLRVGSVVCF